MRVRKFAPTVLLLVFSCNAFSANSYEKKPINIEISGGKNSSEIDFDGLSKYSNLIGAQVRDLSPDQIGEIPVDQFSNIPPSAIALLSNAQIAGITQDQVITMTGDQISQLNSAQIRVFKNKFDSSLFDALFSRLTKQQVVDYVVSSRPEELQKMSNIQIQQLDKSVFDNMSNQQFLSFSHDQLSNFTPGQVNSFNDDQLFWSYSRLTNKGDRDNFIAILNKESVARLLKFIPRSSYKDVFNAASVTALSGLLESVKDSDKQFILSYLSPLTVLRVSSFLNQSEINRLRPDQKTFLEPVLSKDVDSKNE